MRSTTLSSAAGAAAATISSPDGLAIDQVEHLVAVGVLELLGLERLGERLDELRRHLELAVADLDVVEIAVDQLGWRR